MFRTILALTAVAAGAVFFSPAHAQQAPASQSPSTAKQAPSTVAKKPGATQSQGAYRTLKPSDGIDFAAYADKLEATSGGRPSGTLKRFAVVGKDGQLTDLELADTAFTEGRIKTKQFGDIIVASTNAHQFHYQATESQIQKIKLFLATQAHAANPNAPPAAASGMQHAAPATAGSLFLGTDNDKVSYAIGMNIGKRLEQDMKQLKQYDTELDTAIVLRAFEDALAGDKLLMTDPEAQTTLTTLQADLRKRQEEKQKELAENNKKEGEQFLAANKTKEGVVTLPSGLQYKILQEGTGPKPTAADMVTVNYRGTLLNGTEFDSSYKGGKPATFNVGQIIKGWTEALQLMPVGSKWQLFIPSELAYGARGAGQNIGPNSVLVFEVELLSIQPRTPPPALSPVGAAQPATAPPGSAAPSPTPAPTPNPAPSAAQKPAAPAPAPTPKPPTP